MAKQAAQDTSAADATRRKARLRGWLLIIAISLATIMLFVLGTIDKGVRYEWIKL